LELVEYEQQYSGQFLVILATVWASYSPTQNKATAKK
jgi:hypothetical protein